MVAAERIIKTSDAGRRDYLKRFYEVAEELPTHYDLVVNTDGISVEEAAELVAHVAGGRSTFTAPAQPGVTFAAPRSKRTVLPSFRNVGASEDSTRAT